ncbi:MAG: T9SS type A sorting domain-containing protein [Vicingaceae bacterium]
MNRTLLFFICLLSFSTVFSQKFDFKQKVVATNRSNGASFGEDVKIKGDYALSAAHLDNKDESGSNFVKFAGAVYIFKRDSSNSWVMHQKLVASDRSADDYFGFSTAFDGNRIVVGAIFQDKDSIGNSAVGEAGAAYIFEKASDGYWYETQKIVPSDRYYQDQFGIRMDLSGNYLAITSFSDYDENGVNYRDQAGAVYIFQPNSQGKWVETQKVVDNFRNTWETFGFSVKLYNDRLSVGIPFDNLDQNDSIYLFRAGAAAIFKRNAFGVYQFEDKLTSSQRTSQQMYGVHIYMNGNELYVSAVGDELDSLGQNYVNQAGAVYYYEYTNGTWIEKQKIVHSNRSSLDWFGSSLDLDGNTLVVSSYFHDLDTSGGNSKSDAGAAYLFEKNSNGNWVETHKFLAFDRWADDFFGFDLAIDGKDIIIGAPHEAHNASGTGNAIFNAGSAYFYSQCPTSVFLENLSMCEGDSLFIAGAYRHTEGYYIDSFQTSIGCDSNRLYFLDVDSINNIIYEVNRTLYSTVAQATYQWFDCSTGLAIPGEINQTYTPTTNGSYAIEVTVGNCTKRSDCLDINYLGIDKVQKGEIAIFPIPVSTQLTIDFSTLGSIPEKLIVQDALGKAIQTIRPINAEHLVLDVSSYPNGLYFVCVVHSGQNSALKRFVVRH